MNKMNNERYENLTKEEVVEIERVRQEIHDMLPDGPLSEEEQEKIAKEQIKAFNEKLVPLTFVDAQRGIEKKLKTQPIKSQAKWGMSNLKLKLILLICGIFTALVWNVLK